MTKQPFLGHKHFVAILWMLNLNSFAYDDISPIVFPSDARIIDVTKAPYFAKGDGITDDTKAINLALKYHNQSTSDDPMMAWTIYLPAGIYLVSDTVEPKDAQEPRRTQSSVRIVGQGVDKTTIKLKPAARGFADPSKPKYVLRTGNKMGKANSGFGNYIQHLTVDVGSANPGAIGIRYDVANCGAMEDVKIVSSDEYKRGLYGLAFIGPAGIGYIKNITIDGFDVGIFLERASLVNNLVFEHVRLREQRVAGIRNTNKNIVIRDLESNNSVPALLIEEPGAATFLVEADLIGAGTTSAIRKNRDAFLYVRDLRSHNYPTAISDVTSDVVVKRGPFISEWWSHQASFMNNKQYSSLRLPIKDAPEYYNPDLDAWANVRKYGATPDDELDDSAAFQRAIDSGKEIIYFPRGIYRLQNDVIVRGAVKKIDFMFSLLPGPPNNRSTIHVENVSSDAVILENLASNITIVHDSPNTLVIRNKGKGGKIVTGKHATGDLFVENVGPLIKITISEKISAWLRSINRERTPFLNKGGIVWYLGDNVERMQIKEPPRNTLTAIKTIRGTTELIGGAMDALSVRHSRSDLALLESLDSCISATYAGELRFNGEWGSFPVHIRAKGATGEVVIRENDLVFLPTNRLRERRFVLPMFSTKQIPCYP